MVVMWLGGPFKYRTSWTTNRLLSVKFLDHHMNTGSFDNQTQIHHSNTRLVQFKMVTVLSYSVSNHYSTAYFGDIQFWSINIQLYRGQNWENMIKLFITINGFDLWPWFAQFSSDIFVFWMPSKIQTKYQILDTKT